MGTRGQLPGARSIKREVASRTDTSRRRVSTAGKWSQLRSHGPGHHTFQDWLRHATGQARCRFFVGYCIPMFPYRKRPSQLWFLQNRDLSNNNKTVESHARCSFEFRLKFIDWKSLEASFERRFLGFFICSFIWQLWILFTDYIGLRVRRHKKIDINQCCCVCRCHSESWPALASASAALRPQFFAPFPQRALSLLLERASVFKRRTDLYIGRVEESLGLLLENVSTSFEVALECRLLKRSNDV